MRDKSGTETRPRNLACTEGLIGHPTAFVVANPLKTSDLNFRPVYDCRCAEIPNRAFPGALRQFEARRYICDTRVYTNNVGE